IRAHVFVIEKLTEFSCPASHVILSNKHPSIIKGFEQPWRRRGYNRHSTRKSLYTYHSPALIGRWNEQHLRTCPYVIAHVRGLSLKNYIRVRIESLLTITTLDA